MRSLLVDLLDWAVAAAAAGASYALMCRAVDRAGVCLNRWRWHRLTAGRRLTPVAPPAAVPEPPPAPTATAGGWQPSAGAYPGNDPFRFLINTGSTRWPQASGPPGRRRPPGMGSPGPAGGRPIAAQGGTDGPRWAAESPPPPPVDG